ncbi:hypothetical protein ASPWEDRAFT_354198 [Aspergillus wentii DTO 134E9]|uniref:RRM domain-containing protein n=1 Tax=Aspergillus wentii DTO 134E9 TaxID=1073089 RepID=A0A1L9RVY1_ASPWE|nr:uncharacterized protein ASPWEDRAFT_354198 [Aspergillus wentii DTO 134E9]KAI9929214.1 hypothetical protein MW887_001622 [Aspergillus wentii]OJJ39082.1 hypothetical protein ASPWEDRAFT_354198 [Aspergillus wentii DTO 134E9]
MMNPFQIRDLHGSPSRTAESSESRRRDGVVQVSASQYEEIASNHPRARLTYADDDDGELITVGSSLELSQRLDEPIDVPSQEDSHEPMHIFDIRRSNSVTELWKKYEYRTRSPSIQKTEEPSAGSEVVDTTPGHDNEGPSGSGQANAGPAAQDESETLLAAFETELAKMMSASESSDRATPQQDPSSSAETQPGTTSSSRPPNPAEAFTTAMHNLFDGAEMLRSGMRSRIPELERQLHNAQRALPEQVGSTLQSAVTNLDSHVRNLATALGNASVAGEQTLRNDLQGGISPGSCSVDGLRTMASEIGQIGQTLFTAFEAEFGRSLSESNNQTPGEGTSQTGQASTATPNLPAEDSGNAQDNSKNEDEKSTSANLENQENNTVLNEGPNDENIPSSSGFDAGHRMQQPQQVNPLPQASTAHLAGQPQHSGSHLPGAPVQPPIPYPFSHDHSPFHGPMHRPYPLQAPPLPPQPPSYPAHPRPHRRPHPPDHPSPYSRRPWHAGWPSFYGPNGSAPPHRPPHHHHHNHEVPAGDRNTFPRTPAASQERQFAGRTLFVGNVGFNVTEKMIQDVFASKGFLVDVNLPLDSETGKHAGFGYLYFLSVHAAKAALEALQGTHIDGHSVNLELSDHSPITTLHTPHDNRQPSSVPSRAQEPEAFQRRRSTQLRRTSPEEQNSGQNSGIPKGENKSSGEDSNNTSPGNTALLDRDDQDSEFSTRYPSLFPEGATQRSLLNRPSSGNLASLSPRLEMGRFPPVSQLDAHMLANQRRDTDSSSSTSMSEVKPDNDSVRQTGQVPEQANQASFHQYGLHRSNTTVPANPASRLPGPFDPLVSQDTHSTTSPLRRRATERHPPRTDSGRGPMRCGGFRHRPQYSRTDLLNMSRTQGIASATNGNARQPDARERAIDDCVTTLMSLGYGSEKDGGRQRIAVYAAAADGKVNDAIEMIEEERKAYEQQGSST